MFTHFSPFFAHFSPFSTHFSPFSKGQGQTTAIYCQNGECQNGEFHSDPVCTDPVQNFPNQPELLRWLSDSQRESGRLARIDSPKKKTFITFERFARVTSNLQFAFFSALKRDSQKKRGFNSGTLKRFARIRRIARICESIRANRAI